MPAYVSLVQWTEEGIKRYRDSAERMQNFTALVERSGGRVVEFRYTVGDYDMVAITEFDDEQSGIAVLLQTGALGFVRTKTMLAYTAQEMREIVARTG